jgi:hypothetical protein
MTRLIVLATASFLAMTAFVQTRCIAFLPVAAFVQTGHAMSVPVGDLCCGIGGLKIFPKGMKKAKGNRVVFLSPCGMPALVCKNRRDEIL